MKKILDIYDRILKATNSVEAINIISTVLLNAVYDDSYRKECEKLIISPLNNDGNNLKNKCVVYIYRSSVGGEPDYYIINNFNEFQGTFINLNKIDNYTIFNNYKEYKLLYYSLTGELDKFKIDKCTMLDAIQNGVKNIIVCGIYEY